MTLADLRDLLLTITPDVHHYEAAKKSDKYIVWAEDGQTKSTYADNKMMLQVIGGTIDYFTKEEFDPASDAIQTKLNSADISWKLNSIQYEKDTGYTHYEWIFGMVNNVG
jgi:hypothetical protein